MHNFLSGAAPIKSAQNLGDYGRNFSPCDFRSYLYQELLYSDLLGCYCLCSTLLPRPQIWFEWYVKRKMNEFPVQEIKGIRLGVQPHGIVMRQQMGLQEGVGTIGWKISMNGTTP